MFHENQTGEGGEKLTVTKTDSIHLLPFHTRDHRPFPICGYLAHTAPGGLLILGRASGTLCVEGVGRVLRDDCSHPCHQPGHASSFSLRAGGIIVMAEEGHRHLPPPPPPPSGI